MVVVAGKPVNFKFFSFTSAITYLVVATGLAFLLLASMPFRAAAQTDATEVDTLDLKATITCISVYSLFTGDDNEDNVAILQYR